MARTKISFGHKQLAGGVVRAEDAKQDDRGSSAGGREAREKLCDLKLATRDRVAV